MASFYRMFKRTASSRRQDKRSASLSRSTYDDDDDDNQKADNLERENWSFGNSDCIGNNQQPDKTNTFPGHHKADVLRITMTTAELAKQKLRYF